MLSFEKYSSYSNHSEEDKGGSYLSQGYLSGSERNSAIEIWTQLVYNDSVVQRFYHYTTRTLLFNFEENSFEKNW